MIRNSYWMITLVAIGWSLLSVVGCAGNGSSDAGLFEDGAVDAGNDAGDPAADQSFDGGDVTDPADDGGQDPDTDPGDPGGDPGGDTAGDPGADENGDEVVTHECSAGEKLCVDHVTRRFCADTPQGRRWQDEVCGALAGCLLGECVPGECSDACNLGDSADGKTCELYDLGNDSWVATDPAGLMHDRSRAYNMWLRRDGLYFGGVSNAVYSDPPAYTNVVAHGGMGDSTIWTGTYLAAEALRLMATGSADARQNVIDLVNTLHLFFNVSGDPGVLQRWAAPAGQHSGTELDCDDPYHYCGVQYDGSSYDVLGDISRDQYQGVMLGYALAYQALGQHDEDTRALIRDDVVELVEELLQERSIPLQITWNGTDWPIQQINVRFMVICSRELTADNAIHIQLDTDDFSNSLVKGFQEFMPNWGDMISQVTGFGIFTWIPRADSAVMLSSFFRLAMLVTQDIPGYEAQHTAYRDFYYSNPAETGGNVGDWIAIADGWFYNDDCGNKYYANNIVMEPMFNWVRLEDDPAIRQRVLDEVLAARMWPDHQHTKNPFFFYIYAAIDSQTYAGAAQIANEQLPGFPPPPRVKAAVDLRNDSRYLPHESGCSDQTTRDKAVDISERVVRDFIWQRNPWDLYDAGVPALTFPGTDYLVAYWMGRYYGHLQDDTSGKCLAWH